MEFRKQFAVATLATVISVTAPMSIADENSAAPTMPMMGNPQQMPMMYGQQGNMPMMGNQQQMPMMYGQQSNMPMMGNQQQMPMMYGQQGNMPMMGSPQQMPMMYGQQGNMPMMGSPQQMPMMYGQRGCMMNPQMMHYMMNTKYQHMQRMEAHLANIEARLGELVALQRAK